MLKSTHVMSRDEAELAEAVRLALLARGWTPMMVSRIPGDVVIVRGIWGPEPQQYIKPGWWIGIEGDEVRLYSAIRGEYGTRSAEMVERYIPALDDAGLVSGLRRMPYTEVPYLAVRRPSVVQPPYMDRLRW